MLHQNDTCWLELCTVIIRFGPLEILDPLAVHLVPKNTPVMTLVLVSFMMFKLLLTVDKHSMYGQWEWTSASL